jgi:hypothetical protein
MNPRRPNGIRTLMMLTASIALLAPFAAAAARTVFSPPDQIEQHRVLADSANNALVEEKKLPNLTCVQVTHRFENLDNSGWRPIDTIVEQLTYFEHREHYKVLELNGKPASIAHEQLPNAPSSREFGSVMRVIFLPQTQTEFTWQGWSGLRGRRMSVYAYRVRPFRSKFHIEGPGQSLDLVAAYHGLISIDSENHFVHRVTLQFDDIPLSSPIEDVSLMLDYDYARIGDAVHLLPLQFEVRYRAGNQLVKNDVDYLNYQKFNAPAAIQVLSSEADKP